MSAKEDPTLVSYQESLLLEIIKRITNSHYNLNSVKILFERILSDREQYLRYFNKNKQMLISLFEMILSKLSHNTKTTNGDMLQSYICNPEILEILIKLSQNIIVDIQKCLEANNVSEKKKAETLTNLKLKPKFADDPKITTPNNWHMTVNNEVTININGVVFKKPREIIIAPCDYEREMESEDEDSDGEAESKKSKLNGESTKESIQIDAISDQKQIIDYFTKFMIIVISNFNSISFINLKLLGLDNLEKVEFLNYYLEILIDFNFLHYILETKKRMQTGNLDSSSKLGEMDCRFTTNLGGDSFKKQSSDFSQLIDHLTFTNTEIPNDKLKDFLRNIFYCLFKFQEHSLLHKEVEFLSTFLSSKYCPDQIVSIFAKEEKIFDMFTTQNKNITKASQVPHNLANICEVVVRIFLTENKILINEIENSKLIYLI